MSCNIVRWSADILSQTSDIADRGRMGIESVVRAFVNLLKPVEQNRQPALITLFMAAMFNAREILRQYSPAIYRNLRDLAISNAEFYISLLF